MEEKLIEIMEEKVNEVEEASLETLIEAVKKEGMDTQWEILAKSKKEAEDEIANKGEGAKEATEDLVKIEAEMEELKAKRKQMAMEEAKKNIIPVKMDLREAKKTIKQRENARNVLAKANDEIDKLNKYREQVQNKINQDITRENETQDGEGKNSNRIEQFNKILGKIEQSLEINNSLKEKNEAILENTENTINVLSEKYEVQKIMEEKAKAENEAKARMEEEQRELLEGMRKAIEKKRVAEKEKLMKDWDQAIKENEYKDKIRKAKEDIQKKAEQAKAEAEAKAEQAKAEAEAEAKTEQAKAETEVKAKSKATQTSKEMDKKNEPKESSSVKISYKATVDKYIVENVKSGIVKEYNRNDLIGMNKEKIAEKLGKSIDDLKYVDAKILELLTIYDNENKTDKAIQYFKTMTKLESTKKERQSIMSKNEISINYDLRGLYEQVRDEKNGDEYVDAFSLEERKEIFDTANLSKKLGIAKVKKGFFVTIGEFFDRISINRKSNELKSSKEDVKLLNDGKDKKHEEEGLIDRVKVEELVKRNLIKVEQKAQQEEKERNADGKTAKLKEDEYEEKSSSDLSHNDSSEGPNIE